MSIENSTVTPGIKASNYRCAVRCYTYLPMLVTTLLCTLQGTLSRGTLWWLNRHGNTPHYQLHNAYGLGHAKLVASNLQADKHIVLSAATYTGSGAVGGSHAHVQADVACTWRNMKTALETALGQGLVGIPLAGGGSVCGTMGDYDDEVCTRLVDIDSLYIIMKLTSFVTDSMSHSSILVLNHLLTTLYAFKYKRFRNTRHTVTFGIPL
jgi:alpha-glucosidase (family GH31 glycosyl hydrolase)